MKIECILKREGGTKTDVGGVEYHFEPLSDGAHVAEVTEEVHIDRFLAIPEGYKVYHGKETPVGEPKTLDAPKLATTPAPEGKKAVGMLAGSDELPPQFEIGGKVITQLEAVQAAFDASGLSSDEWNELDAEDRAAKIEISLDELAEAAEAEAAAAAAAKAPAKKTATKKA